MNREMKVSTNVGRLSVCKNTDNEPAGITIKLNGTPVIMLEEHKDFCDKLILIKYPNKNVVEDDEYINLSMYDIDYDFVRQELLKIGKEDKE